MLHRRWNARYIVIADKRSELKDGSVKFSLRFVHNGSNETIAAHHRRREQMKRTFL